MKILIIEDEEGIVEFIKEGLKSEGFQVDFATLGEEGLILARDNCYDLILIDLLLPDIHGLTICKKLAGEENPAARIVLTAKNELKMKLDAFKSEVDDYLTKPFSFEELLARMKTVLRRRGENREKTNESLHSRIELNRESREVFVNKRSISLSYYEFLLLDYFLQNLNKVLSRTKILENVWGYNEDPFTNVVDVYICNLRKKLAKYSCGDLIQTVRNIGYKLID
ncbi:response regulator transcription factor [Patescibacteria group bacterium]|nr:MAG: response regulator transcription factor [Patescibacteria group bacterium]